MPNTADDDAHDAVDLVTGPPHFIGLTVTAYSGCVRIRMNRPAARNSLTVASTVQLLAAVRWALRSGARVLVLEGDEQAWCVGGDIGEFHRAPDRGDYIDELAEVLHRLVSELTRADAIVIAAIDGVAAGAGMPLAAAADILIASERARFTLGYNKIGLTPDGGTTLLPATMGLHRSLYLALRNPILTAEQAHRYGLVAEVVPEGQLDGAVDAIVGALANGPGRAMAQTKHLIRGQATAHAESAMRLEALAVRRAADTDEAGEGIAAFLQKRAADFT
ncbi:enoyl-CoA hydratase-related protein [Nocardia sp. FBN12]|uniref:enoyl-CoA hydratase-related protein n=1 Tax=Nocardia sp. FBN12 TaxID=3419766 RepID=UPI003CFFA72F